MMADCGNNKAPVLALDQPARPDGWVRDGNCRRAIFLQLLAVFVSGIPHPCRQDRIGSIFKKWHIMCTLLLLQPAVAVMQMQASSRPSLQNYHLASLPWCPPPIRRQAFTEYNVI